MLKAIVRSFFLNAEQTIVLGKVWKDFVIDEVGVNKKYVVILPNAVTGPEHFPAIEEKKLPPHILFLGRLGVRKGAPEMIEALAASPLKALPWAATLAGDGDIENTRKLVVERGLASKVDVPGWVGPIDVATLLARSSILALPSHAENLPLSMLEGMAYGLCPVVTPVGAIEDVITNGKNGILVPVGDSEALSNALIDLLENPEKCRRLALAARQTFEQGYDIKNYGQQLTQIYKNILDRDQ